MSHGLIFGNYLVLARLDSGGMSEIFLAKARHALDTDDFLVIKRILPHLAHNPDFVSMLVDEAKIAAGLTHPNICRMHDLGLKQDELFLVMEFVRGKSLRLLLRRALRTGACLPHDLSAFVVMKMAEALDYAHTKQDRRGQPIGIVHRDVNPHNTLIAYDGVPKLIDFGVAKARNRIGRTRVGYIKGKVPYMSPEQVAARPLDSRTDIFALGAVLYELVAGRRAFTGRSELAVLNRVRDAAYEPLLRVTPAAPRELADVVERALQRDPGSRFASAGEMALEMRAYLDAARSSVDEAALSAHMHRMFASEAEEESRCLSAFAAISAAGAEAVGHAKTFPGRVIDATASAHVKSLGNAADLTDTVFLAADYGGEESDSLSEDDDTAVVDSGQTVVNGASLGWLDQSATPPDAAPPAAAVESETHRVEISALAEPTALTGEATLAPTQVSDRWRSEVDSKTARTGEPEAGTPYEVTGFANSSSVEQLDRSTQSKPIDSRFYTRREWTGLLIAALAGLLLMTGSYWCGLPPN